MKGKKDTGRIKRIIDISMTLVLLCLMAYQVTGEAAHEFIGVGMTLLCIVHQILNRRWYGTLLKGKYKAFRVLQTGINILLIMSFAVTAFCGMSMSTYAVPFMYGILRVSLVRRVHLSMSHWSFVLMGLHLGLHVPVMTARLKLTDKNQDGSGACPLRPCRNRTLSVPAYRHAGLPFLPRCFCFPGL